MNRNVVSCIGNTPLVRLTSLFPAPSTVLAKLEMLNPAGSIKDRVAAYVIAEGLRDGVIHPATHLIESSSGNFGIALAMVARRHGLHFTCVVDPNITRANLRILQCLGATVDMVEAAEPQHGSYLHARLERVHQLLDTTPNSYWINQYANPLCRDAHYFGTANEILAQLGDAPDTLIAPVSTSGTITGISARLRQAAAKTRVVAVDAVGSAVFGSPSCPRSIPGLGSGRVPELLQTELIDDIVWVDDRTAVRACRQLALREGILAGGSSGAVIEAAQQLLAQGRLDGTAVLVLPDRGERYLDTVYDDGWAARLPQARPRAASAAGPRVNSTGGPR
jgi:2,3-diaminopropionate biosynthesis protein SbnA